MRHSRPRKSTARERLPRRRFRRNGCDDLLRCPIPHPARRDRDGERHRHLHRRAERAGQPCSRASIRRDEQRRAQPRRQTFRETEREIGALGEECRQRRDPGAEKGVRIVLDERERLLANDFRDLRPPLPRHCRRRRVMHRRHQVDELGPLSAARPLKRFWRDALLMKTLPKVATEMALSVLAYNLTRVMNIIGVRPLLVAIGA